MATSWNQMSNEQIASLLGEALRGMRLRQNISQGDLATLAGVSLPTLNRMEAGTANPSLFVLLSVLKALGRAGDLEAAFAPESSPMLIATGAKGTPRKKARRKGSEAKTISPWTWGDEK